MKLYDKNYNSTNLDIEVYLILSVFVKSSAWCAVRGARPHFFLKSGWPSARIKVQHDLNQYQDVFVIACQEMFVNNALRTTHYALNSPMIRKNASRPGGVLFFK